MLKAGMEFCLVTFSLPHPEGMTGFFVPDFAQPREEYKTQFNLIRCVKGFNLFPL